MEMVTLPEGAGPSPQIQYIEVVTADYDHKDALGRTYVDLASVDPAVNSESYATFCTSETCEVQPDSVRRANLEVIDSASPLSGETAESITTAEPLVNVHSSTFPTQSQTQRDPALYVKHVVINGHQQTVLVDGNDRQVAALSGDTAGLPGTTLPAASPVSICNINDSEEPLYVNAKQYHRILKRREARAKLEARHKIYKARSKFLYNSRHSHAKKRPRGPGGKFLKQPIPEEAATSPGHT